MSLVDMIIGKDRLREQRDTTISAIEEKYDPSAIQPQLDFAEDLAREGIEDEADLSRRNFLVNSFAGEEPARLTGGNQATALASANATSEAQMGALSELERDLSRQDIEAKRQGRSALAKGRSQQRTILGERDSQIDQAETMFNAEVDRRKRGLVSSIVGTAGAIATTPFGGGGSLLSRGLGKAFGGANAIAEGANAVTEAGDFLGMMDGINAIPNGEGGGEFDEEQALDNVGFYLDAMYGANAVSNGEGGGYSSAYAGPITSRNQRPDNSDRPRVSNNQPNGQDVNELLQNADDQLMGSGVLTPENFDQRLDTPEQVDPFGDIDGEQVLAEFKADVAKENHIDNVYNTLVVEEGTGDNITNAPPTGDMGVTDSARSAYQISENTTDKEASRQILIGKDAELSQKVPNYDEAPSKLKEFILNTEYNTGNVFTFNQFTSNMRASNWYEASKQLLDTANREGQSVRGLAERRARNFNGVADEIGQPRITDVEQTNDGEIRYYSGDEVIFKYFAPRHPQSDPKKVRIE